MTDKTDKIIKNNEEQYWLDQLWDMPQRAVFPRDQVERENPETDHAETGTREFHLEDKTFDALNRLSNGSHLRMHMILTAITTLLLRQYTGLEDILAGTSIYKQEKGADFLNTHLVLRNRAARNMSFKDLLMQVRGTIVKAVENQNYPVESLLQKLKVPYSRGDEFPLFDTAILLENIQDKNHIRHNGVKVNVVLSFSHQENNLQGQIEYTKKYYHTSTIDRMITHFQHLATTLLQNPNTRIGQADVLSREEKELLLQYANGDPTTVNPTNSIEETILRHASQSPNTTALITTSGQTMTYGELARQSTPPPIQPGTIIALELHHSPELIIAILATLRSNNTYLPIDPTYPKERKNYMLADSGAKPMPPAAKGGWGAPTAIKFFEKPPPLDPPEKLLFSRCLGPVLDCPAYVLYTSGSTGRPKGVAVGRHSLNNYVLWATKTYANNSPINFPLYTSISFDLTVTSIFTPLATGGTIVIYDNKKNDKNDFENTGKTLTEPLIQQVMTDQRYPINAIKLTPSHLALLGHDSNNTPLHPNIRCIIVGGEQLTAETTENILKRFKNPVAIYNEYGPTEATVGCTIYKYDSPKYTPGERTGAAVPIGRPITGARVELLSPLDGTNPVPQGVTGEIHISGTVLAHGYLNNPELTAQKFVPRPNGGPGRASPWPPEARQRHKTYKTGDLGRLLPGGELEFLGRKDRQVKIRGHRIEPGEIAAYLLRRKDLKDAAVIFREGALYAYVVPRQAPETVTGAVEEYRQYLSAGLPGYMVPPYIVLLDGLPLTVNGKLDTGALPVAESAATATYAAPRNRCEKQLVAIWRDVLGANQLEAEQLPEQIGIDDHFFQLGGHSLKATILAARIHKDLGVRIPLAKIFENPTIRGLSSFIPPSPGESAHDGGALEPAEEKEYYAASLTQKRFYILQTIAPDSTAYNLPLVLELEGTPDMKRIRETLAALVRRHESLRTRFEMIDGDIVQSIQPPTTPEIEDFECAPEEINHTVHRFVRPFDPGKLPLMRVGLIRIPGGATLRHILMIDMHHIISDGVSTVIFSREFIRLYSGGLIDPNTDPGTVPAPRYRYRDFSEWQNRPQQAQRIREQGAYWLNCFPTAPPLLQLRTDFPRPAVRGFGGGKLDFEINAPATTGLRALAAEEGMSLFMVLFAIYHTMLYKMTGQGEIVIGTGTAGRNHADLGDIIGLFFNTIPLRTRTQADQTFRQFLSTVKQTTLGAFDNQDYPLDLLVEELSNRGILKRDSSRTPLFDTMFALQNFREQKGGPVEAEFSGLKVSSYDYERRNARFDLFLFGAETLDTIEMNLEYSTTLFKKETAETIAGFYREITDQVLDNTDIPMGDITISDRRVEVDTGADKEEYTDFGF